MSTQRESSELTLDLVDNAPIRQAVLASGLTLSEIARRIGYDQSRSRTVGGQVRLRRILGLATAQTSRPCRTSRQTRMTYENALRIAQAINVDPVDIGL